MCQLCDGKDDGELVYEDGEILIGCADCLLEIVSDPRKPVFSIRDYTAICAEIKALWPIDVRD